MSTIFAADLFYHYEPRVDRERPFAPFWGRPARWMDLEAAP